MFEGPLRYIVVMALVIIVLRFVLQYAYSKANEQKSEEGDGERGDSYAESNSTDFKDEPKEEADSDE
jgi:hypothetical protein